MVVPGSMEVKRQAEAEGLPAIFRAAGCDWREPGCSMCIAMNGDQLQPGEYSVSTSNRNFEGRQGKGGRTFLASPADRRRQRPHRRCHRCEDHFCETVHSLRVAPRSAAAQQYRYRPDHSRALPQDNLPGRPRPPAFLRLAIRRAGKSEARFHPEYAARPERARFCWPATTSAAAVRASTPRGR